MVCLFRGATNWEYILDDAPVTAAGNYSIRIENTVGVYTSKNIPVNVLDKPMLQLINPKLVENFFTFELPDHYTGSYSVICKDTIDEQQWKFLKLMDATNGPISIESITPGATQKFFRLRQ